MLQIVLLAGKFVFLIVLYLFIYRVIRSTNREFRASVAKQPVGGLRPAVSGGPKPAAFGGRPVPSGVGSPAGPGSPPGAGHGVPGVVWALVVEKSPSLRAGEAYELPFGASILAGRAPETDIYLEDTFVSSKHALFESTDSGLLVEDLRSTNGTLVNGAEIAEARSLRAGDKVEVGDTVFRVEVR